MRKTHESMKVTNNFLNVFRCGYCDLQNIFYGIDPVYYNAGVYGWNNDMYIDYSTDTIITTGYRNMRGDSINHDLIRKYDKKARAIVGDWTISYDDKMKKLAKIRTAFINEILNK